ncbi:PQQ-binding-like beta-propeller repeat protein [Neolewinella persica]|uniref:hypothetical protein n=1 Tax=Neolewinella persica TaxID=70998 RepID=UPI000363CB37|nr:hypothetical protein [Neolewinella persica]
MRLLIILYFLSFSFLSAQTPFLKEYGPVDNRSNEEATSLLADTSFITAVYREEGGASGVEQLVFARFDRETGAPQDSFRTMFPYSPNALAAIVTSDQALVTTYILPNGHILVSKYRNDARLIATDTLSTTGFSPQRISLKETLDGKIVLAAISSEQVDFFSLTSALAIGRTTVYESGGPSFQDFTVLPSGDYLTFQSAAIGDGYTAFVIDAENGDSVTAYEMEGSNGLQTFSTGRFVQHPENNQISLVLRRFISQDFPLQPVIFPFDENGIPGTPHDLAPMGGENNIFLQGVSPQGDLVWLFFNVGLFVHRNYEQSGDVLLPLTGLPQFNGQPVNGINRIVDNDEIFFLSAVFINTNDRDVLLTNTNLAQTSWQQRLGLSGGLTNDEAIAVSRDPLGNIYLLSASPTTDQREIVTTVLKTTPVGDTVWVKRFRGPEGQVTTPHQLTFRGDGLLFLQHYANGNSYQEVLGPDGVRRHPQKTESLEGLQSRGNRYDALPVGGGQVLTFRVDGNVTVMDFYGADGSRRYSTTFPNLSNPNGMKRLEDNTVLLMGRSRDGTDRVHIVKFDLTTRQEVWSRNLGPNSSTGTVDFARNLVLLPNGDYALVTITLSFIAGSPPEGLNLYRITPPGGISAPAFFEQPTPFTEQGVGAYLTPNDALIVTSVTTDDSTSLLRSFRLRTDDFNVIETVEEPIPYQDFLPRNILPTSNGYIALYGQANKFITRSAQLFVLSTKVDNDPTNTANARPFSGQVRVFPNPSTGPQVLTVELPSASTLDLRFFDASGRLLSSRWLSAATDHQLLLEANELPVGVTILQIIEPSGASHSIRLFRSR